MNNKNEYVESVVQYQQREIELFERFIHNLLQLEIINRNWEELQSSYNGSKYDLEREIEYLSRFFKQKEESNICQNCAKEVITGESLHQRCPDKAQGKPFSGDLLKL